MTGSSSNGVGAYILLAFLVVMSILRRRGVRQTKSGSLSKGERQRPILMTWLDPLLSIVFVGGVLWGLMSRDVVHVLFALVGAAAGVPLGVARARTMYVRAVPDAKSVIFRRSTLEYGLLAVLLVLRIVERSIADVSPHHTDRTRGRRKLRENRVDWTALPPRSPKFPKGDMTIQGIEIPRDDARDSASEYFRRKILEPSY